MKANYKKKEQKNKQAANRKRDHFAEKQGGLS